jgi:5-formyltetrahydrofolate cyclo-ligase
VIDKPALRTRMRAARRRFAPVPLIVPDALRAWFSRGTIVSAYVPVDGEADPAPLVAAALAAGCTIALPHVVDRATPMRFIAEDGVLLPGPFGLRQPGPHGREMAPDVVLTPLVAFDRAGNRLGQGAGYYDRAFVQFPAARRVGVAWSVQEVDALPADPWDVPLHAIITETEWIEP